MKASVKWPALRKCIDDMWEGKSDITAVAKGIKLLNEEIEGATVTNLEINKQTGEWEVIITYENSGQADQEEQIREAIKNPDL